MTTSADQATRQWLCGFYRWPYGYFGQHVDERVQPPAPAQVARAIAPDYALGAHTAPLGLLAARGSSLPNPFAEGMFIGQHGPWNRRPRSGYQVIFVPFANGKPTGALPVEVLTGFLSQAGTAYGRPTWFAEHRVSEPAWTVDLTPCPGV